ARLAAGRGVSPPSPDHPHSSQPHRRMGSYRPVRISYRGKRRRPIDAKTLPAGPSARARRRMSGRDSSIILAHAPCPLLEKTMNKPIHPRHPLRLQPLAAALAAMFLVSGVALAADVNVTLSGDQEVPPV